MGNYFDFMKIVGAGILSWIGLFIIGFCGVMFLIIAIGKIVAKTKSDDLKEQSFNIEANTIDNVDCRKLPELVSILTNDDKNAVEDIRLLVEANAAFAAKYHEWFADWFADADAKEYDFLTAYFIVGYGTEYKYGSYIDWKEETEEIISGLQKAIDNLRYSLKLTDIAFTGEEFTDEALQIIQKYLRNKGYCLVCWDTQSDSYHLFIVPQGKYEKVVELGQSMKIRFFAP